MESLIAQITQEVHALHLFDLVTIVTLAGLEGILSVDNALVLAILVRTLPEEQRKKALTYGIVGAFVFRFIALVFAAYLMQMSVFKLVGGGYLIFIAMKHMFFFTKEDAERTRVATGSNFWKTVAVVELTDIAFSIDSITTAVAMTDKLVIVWLGGILGIIFLRFAAGFFVRLLERLPRLEDLAYQLVFFVGTKLVLEGFHYEIAHGVFWLMMGIIAILGAGLVYRDSWQRRNRDKFETRLLEQLKKGEISAQELLDLEYVPKEVIQLLHREGWLDLRLPPTR